MKLNGSNLSGAIQSNVMSENGQGGNKFCEKII